MLVALRGIYTVYHLSVVAPPSEVSGHSGVPPTPPVLTPLNSFQSGPNGPLPV